jgi:hypothetical protein
MGPQESQPAHERSTSAHETVRASVLASPSARHRLSSFTLLYLSAKLIAIRLNLSGRTVLNVSWLTWDRAWIMC